MRIRKRWVVVENGVKIKSRHWTKRSAEKAAESVAITDAIARLIASRLIFGEGNTISGFRQLPPHVYSVEEDI